jgi:hypothetical protein
MHDRNKHLSSALTARCGFGTHCSINVPTPGRGMSSSEADANDQLPRGRPFAPGESGNPNGRPKGSRNKATIASEALLDGEAEALTRKVIELALGGNLAALRLCFDRLLPPRRDRSVAFDLPRIESAADAVAASDAVLAACAEGTLSPGEAADVMGLVQTQLRTIELAELEARVATLEQASRETKK